MIKNFFSKKSSSKTIKWCFRNSRFNFCRIWYHDHLWETGILFYDRCQFDIDNNFLTLLGNKPKRVISMFIGTWTFEKRTLLRQTEKETDLKSSELGSYHARSVKFIVYSQYYSKCTLLISERLFYRFWWYMPSWFVVKGALNRLRSSDVCDYPSCRLLNKNSTFLSAEIVLYLALAMYSRKSWQSVPCSRQFMKFTT